jgi:hypothetical protein
MEVGFVAASPYACSALVPVGGPVEGQWCGKALRSNCSPTKVSLLLQGSAFYDVLLQWSSAVIVWGIFGCA